MGKQLFKDKIVWITGASSGIGKSLALAFAREGAHVAISGRRKERLEEVSEEIEALGQKALVLPCDVTKENEVKDAVVQIVSSFERLDVAVANAGFGVSGRFEQLSIEDWRRQLDVNVIGAVSTALHALPELKKSGGRLALIASVSSLICIPTASAYSASKFALRAIGLTLSQELANTSVTCTTIHPGFVESEITQVDNKGNFREEFKDRRPKRLMWSGEKAAQVMIKAIYRRKREYVFTLHGKLGAFLGKHVPSLVHLIMSRQNLSSKSEQT